MTDPLQSTAAARARALTYARKLAPAGLLVLAAFLVWPFVMRTIDGYRDRRVDHRTAITLPAVRAQAKEAHKATAAAVKAYVPAKLKADSLAKVVTVWNDTTLSVSDSLVPVPQPVTERILTTDTALARADRGLTLAQAEAAVEKARGDTTDRQLKDVTRQRDRARSRFKWGVVVGAASYPLVRAAVKIIARVAK